MGKDRNEYHRQYSKTIERKAWLERNRARLAEYRKKWREQKIAEGRMRDQYLEHKDKGLCPTCGKEQPTGYARVRCKECLSRNKRKGSIKRDYMKAKAVAYLGGRCADCKQSFECPAVYDFHHRKGTEKDFSISWAIGKGMPDFSAIKPELDKCDLLCANCHRVRHFTEKRKG